jgi:hypothetical protein
MVPIKIEFLNIALANHKLLEIIFQTIAINFYDVIKDATVKQTVCYIKYLRQINFMWITFNHIPPYS